MVLAVVDVRLTELTSNKGIVLGNEFLMLFVGEKPGRHDFLYIIAKDNEIMNLSYERCKKKVKAD